MTSTMDNMEKIVKSFTEKGIRNKVKIIVGGAPITPDYASEIGADASRPDAMEAAKWAKEIVKDLPDNRWN
jgi:methanogenic corrinoid protein MtbC1